MSTLSTHREVLNQLESLCAYNLKRCEIYTQRALADPNKSESVLAHYYQGRYDAYCMARNILAEALGGSDG